MTTLETAITIKYSTNGCEMVFTLAQSSGGMLTMTRQDGMDISPYMASMMSPELARFVTFEMSTVDPDDIIAQHVGMKPTLQPVGFSLIPTPYESALTFDRKRFYVTVTCDSTGNVLCSHLDGNGGMEIESFGTAAEALEYADEIGIKRGRGTIGVCDRETGLSVGA